MKSSKQILQNLLNPNVEIHPKITEDAWHFDRSRIKNSELVPCLFWEYARESVSIKQAVETVKTAIANERIPYRPSPERDRFNVEAEKAFGVLSGIGFEILFWTSLPFPELWLSIDEKARRQWAGKSPRDSVLASPPFRVVSDHPTAGELYKEAKSNHAKKLALEKQLYEIDQALDDPAKIDDIGKNLEISRELHNQRATLPPLVVRGHGGVEWFICQINWRDFNNRDIGNCLRKWVKKNRPPAFPQPRGRGRGETDADRRASLERLGIMRLMHHHTFDELTQIVPVEWLNRDKYNNKAECVKERKKAISDFHRLFPFLPEENPHSFEPLPGAW